jgi:type I restriction enzyme, S subunit
LASETNFKETEIGFIPEERIMNSKPWPIVEVQEVCDLIVDCVNKTAPTVDHITPYKMIRTTNIRFGKVDLTECRYVEADTYEKWTRRAKVKAGDILLTREAPLGEVGYINFDDTVFLGQRIMQYRANPKRLDSRYLHYAFMSPALRHQFGVHEGSGSVVSHIRVGDCYKFEIPLPQLYEQRAITHILGTLDDKISVNYQINQTLEAIAQAIFKSWFVDFEPVKAKISAIEAGEDADGVTRAAMSAISGKTNEELDQLKVEQPEYYTQLKKTAELFPSSMQDSKLGEIPEGWEVKAIQDLAKTIKGKSYKSDELAESKTALVTLKSFNRGGGYRLDGLKEYTGSYKAEQEVFAGDLIIAYTDVTQSADVIGKPAMVVSDSRYAHLVISLDVAVVRPEIDNHKYFLYGLAMTSTFQNHTKSYTTGTKFYILRRQLLLNFNSPNHQKNF